MKTAAELEESFRRDLADLLTKHRAEMDITDDGRSYGMHSGICRVTIMPTFDDNGDPLSAYTEFLL